jgi:alkylation response protein AidB-like acyl-CoA dehydrogenase
LALFLCRPSAHNIQVRPHVGIDPTTRICEARFADVRVSGDDLLGGGPDAGALQFLLNWHAAAAGAEMTGAAARVLDMAIGYSGQRVQFGRPVGSFQAIKHKCADMMVAVETARSAAYYAAWAVATNDPASQTAASMAKAFCGDACRMTCNEGLQIHGGIGFTAEYDLHFYMKRGKYLEYAYGDADWHREQVAAALLGTE